MRVTMDIVFFVFPISNYATKHDQFIHNISGVKYIPAVSQIWMDSIDGRKHRIEQIYSDQ